MWRQFVKVDGIYESMDESVGEQNRSEAADATRSTTSLMSYLSAGTQGSS